MPFIARRAHTKIFKVTQQHIIKEWHVWQLSIIINNICFFFQITKIVQLNWNWFLCLEHFKWSRKMVCLITIEKLHSNSNNNNKNFNNNCKIITNPTIKTASGIHPIYSNVNAYLGQEKNVYIIIMLIVLYVQRLGFNVHCCTYTMSSRFASDLSTLPPEVTAHKNQFPFANSNANRNSNV